MQDVHPIGGSSSGGGNRVFGDRRLRPHSHHHHHQAAALKCPRCDSLNTKFCYFNNYNLSQPRHFCKNCRRYWTKGGVLRNVPVGGGCRKAKRSSSSSSSKSKSPSLSSKKDSNSHSSSTESSTTTTTAVAPTTVGSSSHSVVKNLESENYIMDMGLEPLLFPSTEMGGFMNLMSNFTADPLGLSGCDAATTASFSQFLQNQAAVQDWEVRTTTGGVHQEYDKMHRVLDGVLDPTVRIDDYRGNNSGLATLDWQPASDHGLFDLPSTVDHQPYWSQTTTSHHHMWSDHANNDHNLFLP